MNEIIGYITATIVAIGSISAIILYFLNRDTTKISSLKELAETDQIEYNLELNHAQQIKQWIKDLEDFRDTYNVKLAKKDEVIAETHQQYLSAVKDMVEAQARLEKFNRANRRLVTSMDVPYWECNSEGKLTYVNGCWLELFGLTPEEAYADKWLQVVSPEERESLMIEWHSQIIDQKEIPLSFKILDRETGEYIKVTAIYSIIYGELDSIYKIIGVTVKNCL